MADVRISPEVFAQQAAIILQVAERYRDDADFRATVSGDARDALAGMGLALPEGVEVRVHANTADTMYLVMPPDPNGELSDEALVAVAGGGVVSSIFSASSIGCIPFTASTVATVGSYKPGST